MNLVTPKLTYSAYKIKCTEGNFCAMRRSSVELVLKAIGVCKMTQEGVVANRRTLSQGHLDPCREIVLITVYGEFLTLWSFNIVY